MPRTYLLILSVLFFATGRSQSIESLVKIVTDKKSPDTVRLSAMYDLAWEYIYTNPDSSIAIAQRQLKLARDCKNKKWEAKAYNAIGASYQIWADFPKAIDNYQKGLRIYEEISDKSNMAGALGNIGSLYIDLKKYDKALDFQQRCLKLVQEIANLNGVASALNNIGIIYSYTKDLEKALLYNEKALEMYKMVGDQYGLTSATANMGNLYFEMHEYDKSVKYLKDAIAMARKNEFKKFITSTLAELSKVYLAQKKYDLALGEAEEANQLAETEKDLSSKMVANNVLGTAYHKLGKYKEAVQYYEEYMRLKDTIYKDQSEAEITKLEVQFEYDKKAAADSLKNAEEQKMKDMEIFAKNTQIEKDRMQKIALYGGIFLMIISGGVMYNRFRVIRRQKNIIEIKSKETEEQKIIIEEKQKEILSSIAYAKRLQEAILPPKNAITDHLPDSFILYKPKDIVAGDFYWMESTGNNVLIAAADCTGHGVPGALVSVVCSNALNRAVNEFSIQEPGKILDKTRELVVETFERSETEVKDGMDISLCLINKTRNELEWAGANNPLWIIRNSELIEFKPNKQAIGKVDNPSVYTTHRIQLQKNDCIYIFTDGYADQFGGPNGKKFKYKQLYDLMISLYHLPIPDQLTKIETEFSNWKGNLEQVDDVCVIGIKI